MKQGQILQRICSGILTLVSLIEPDRVTSCLTSLALCGRNLRRRPKRKAHPPKSPEIQSNRPRALTFVNLQTTPTQPVLVRVVWGPPEVVSIEVPGRMYAAKA